jgi:hypothetical protein
MMNPDPTILGAYYRRRGEDRVTEVLATVLTQSPPLAGELAAHLGLDPPERCDVTTQIPIQGGIIDLQIQGYDADRRTIWLLWSEHKVNAPFAPGQLARYARELPSHAQGISHQQVAITLNDPTTEDKREASAHDVRLLRWQEVSALVDKAGQRLSGGNWRSRRCEGELEIQRRFLLEWLAFADNELEAAMEPLTPDTVAMLPQAERLIGTIDHLLATSLTGACAELKASVPKYSSSNDCFIAAPHQDSWLAQAGMKLYMTYDSDGTWVAGTDDGPVFALGAWTDGGEYADLLSGEPRLRALEDDGFLIDDEPSGKTPNFDISTTLSMSEVARTNADLAGQEAALTKSVHDAFAKLLAALPSAPTLDPPPAAS